MCSTHIKRKTEWVSEAKSIYLGFGCSTYKWIIRRNIIRASVYIDTQDIAHQVGIIILSVSTYVHGIPVRHMSITLIISISSVTNGDIQKSIGTKSKCTCIVI